MSTATTNRFPLGRLSITATANRVIPVGEVMEALRRHHGGDWGDVCEEDGKANDDALNCGDRLFSVYHTASPQPIKFYVITEWDRSATTVLLPEDY